MSRYIDKETMRGIIREQEKSHGIRGLAWIEMAMDKQEDADVVEVTRCRYCKFYRPYNKPVEDFDGRCFARNCETDEYDFCSYGAKMDEEEQK